MTRLRLAAIAALIIPVLLIATSGGEAQTEDVDYDAEITGCKMVQEDTDDVKVTTTGKKRTRGPRGPGRPGGAAAVGPAAGVKVVTKLRDLTPSNGDNVVDGKDVDRTNDDGVAKTKLQLDNFGNYRVVSKMKVDGEVVAKDAKDFGVTDREGGKCDPPIPGAG